MLAGVLGPRAVARKAVSGIRSRSNEYSSQHSKSARFAKSGSIQHNQVVFSFVSKRGYADTPVNIAFKEVRRMGKPNSPVQSLRELRKSDPRKHIENDLSFEKNLLRKDLPVYVPEEIQRVEAEAKRFKAAGQLPPPEISRQLMYINFSRNSHQAAYVNFYDLKQREVPTLFDFNLTFAWNGAAKSFSHVHETYDYMKEHGIKMSLLTMKVLFKCFGESGSIGRIMEVYEQMFLDGYIPDRANLESVLKAAALGGDPHYFYLFYDRLQRKRFPINNAILKSLTDKWKTGSLNRDPRMSGVKLSANDFSNTMAIVLRVHNYRLAIELIRECRDTHNIQPDAYMYETFLEACIRAGHLREKARIWKKKFHQYPKGIEKREDHFEFLDFVAELQEHLAKQGTNFIKHAKPKDQPPGVHETHTTRKQSRQLYKNYPRIRYVSQFDEETDFLEWVPDYRKRREAAPILQQEEFSAAALADIQDKALEDLRAKQAVQEGSQ